MRTNDNAIQKHTHRIHLLHEFQEPHRQSKHGPDAHFHERIQNIGTMSLFSKLFGGGIGSHMSGTGLHLNLNWDI